MGIAISSALDLGSFAAIELPAFLYPESGGCCPDLLGASASESIDEGNRLL